MRSAHRDNRTQPHQQQNGQDAVEEGRSGPLRRAVVDQLEQNSPWLEPFYAPAADTGPRSWSDWLANLWETTTYVEGEMEIIATCQVLGVNIEIIGNGKVMEVAKAVLPSSAGTEF
eukprot:COSAG04_NODE_2274_length_4412_cov_2.410851_2_plen_116_part_00